MPGYAQEGQMIYPLPSPIGDGRMPEIMKLEYWKAAFRQAVLNASPLHGIEYPSVRIPALKFVVRKKYDG